MVPEVKEFPPKLRSELIKLKFIKEKNRCMSCNKRLGLTGLECKCGDKYCSLHRQPSDHNCTFDFKAHGKKLIEKKNIKLCADKLKDKL